jgi:nicotine blue oxidoreductase
MGNQGAEGTAGRRATGIVLAAGAGTRLGLGPKALLPYRGRPLVESVAGALLDGGCREVLVVLGGRGSGRGHGRRAGPLPGGHQP